MGITHIVLRKVRGYAATPYDGPGIGKASELALLSEFIDITQLKNFEALATYVEMIPMCHSSGEQDKTEDFRIYLHCNIIEAA